MKKANPALFSTRRIAPPWAKMIMAAFLLFAGGHAANDALAGPAGKDAAGKGLAIAIEADRRDHGFKDYAADMTMTLRSSNGSESHRRLSIKVLEGRDDGDKSLIVFSRPRDISGGALLTFAHKKGNDDQWIYLPALKRVKRISSTNRSGAFVGSEFAYEDLIRPEVERYTYLWLRDEAVDGQPAHAVERTPAYQNSGYRRQIVWYDQAEFRVLRIEFFDRNNALLKRFTASDYQKYLGKYWRPALMIMINLQNDKSTNLSWKNYEFKNGYNNAYFNKNRIKNLR